MKLAWPSSSVRPALWLASFFAAVTLQLSAADDLSDLREQVRKLQEQNRTLQQQLQDQKQMVESLGRKVDKLDDNARNAPEPDKDDLKPGPLTKALSFGKVMASGQGAIGLYHQGSDGQYSKSGFVLDEAKLFVEANFYKKFYLYSELLIAQREEIDEFLRVGELYLEWEEVLEHWNQEKLLNLRLGRINIPFGEEYLVRDAIFNPLISHSLADFWGVDEGLELYGSAGKFKYVVAVQNGGDPKLRDFDPDKSVALRLSYDPTAWLHLSASGMRTGDLNAKDDFFSAMWFGNGYFRALGAAATTTKFQADLAQGDIQFRWHNGHVNVAGGAIHYDDNDTAADNRRDVYFYSVEAMQELGAKFYGAARVSQIFAPGGFPLVGSGQFGPRMFGGLTTDLWRLSIGAGYRFSRDLVVKLEYSLNSGKELSGKKRNEENFVGFQAAFRF